LLLDDEHAVRVSSATRHDVQQAIAYLQGSAWYPAEQRTGLLAYLMGVLAAFQDDTETLADVEKRRLAQEESDQQVQP
jgi:hypothetical protein